MFLGPTCARAQRAAGIQKEDGSTHIGIRATTYSAEEWGAGLWDILGLRSFGFVALGFNVALGSKRRLGTRHICLFLHEPYRPYRNSEVSLVFGSFGVSASRASPSKHSTSNTPLQSLLSKSQVAEPLPPNSIMASTAPSFKARFVKPLAPKAQPSKVPPDPKPKRCCRISTTPRTWALRR